MSEAGQAEKVGLDDRELAALDGALREFRQITWLRRALVGAAVVALVLLGILLVVLGRFGAGISLLLLVLFAGVGRLLLGGVMRALGDREPVLVLRLGALLRQTTITERLIAGGVAGMLAGVLLATGTLAGVLVLFVVAAGLAAASRLLIGPLVDQQRGPAVQEISRLLDELRRRGVSEDFLRNLLIRRGGAEAADLVGLLWGEAAEMHIRRRSRPAGQDAWQDLLIRRVDRLIEARQRRTQPTAPATAEPQSQPATSPPAAAGAARATAATRSTPSAPRAGPAPSEAGPADRPAAGRPLVAVPDEPRLMPLVGRLTGLLLGTHVRGALGVLLLAAAATWFGQNDLSPAAEWAALAGGNVTLNEQGHWLAATHQTEPLSVPLAPGFATAWLNSYNALAAGLLLIFSCLVGRAWVSFFILPAAAVLLFPARVDGSGVTVAVAAPYLPWAAAGALLAGAVVTRAAVSLWQRAGAWPFERRITERSVSLVNSRGEVLHAAPGPRLWQGGAAVRLLRRLLAEAIAAGASDLHVEPQHGTGIVRMRVHGVLVKIAEVDDDALLRRLLGLVRVLCEIDTGSMPRVQDGSFTVGLPSHRVDCRTSFTPAVDGQKLAIRLLDARRYPGSLDELHMPTAIRDRVRGFLRQEGGMLIAAGPTGSGKTTTLYAALRELDAGQRHVVSIEEPVEYHVEGFTQLPVRQKAGHDFASLLRSTLRHDPDIILVGETRDADTARTTMQAALTGHLVLSTVHATDTAGALLRLLELVGDRDLLASSVGHVLGQRLIRLLCLHCRRSRPLDDDARQDFQQHGLQAPARLYIPGGCPRCFGTGYGGRRAVFEMLLVDDALREQIRTGAGIAGLRQAQRTHGIGDLHREAWRLAAAGLTSREELSRVCPEHSPPPGLKNS